MIVRNAYWKNLGLILAVGCLSILVAGCPITPVEEPPEPGFESDGTVGIDSELFSSDSEDPSVTVFKTNDPDHWTTNGYTIWALSDTAPRDFVSIDVSLSKISGNSTAGYGLVVNQYYDDEFGTVLLVLMINTEGEYIIGEVVQNQFFPFQPWKSSSYLVSGYNQSNRITLSYDGDSDEYSLRFNGNEETVFEDNEAPYHTRGYGGYVVVISNLDSFPETPVETRFELHD